MTARVTRVLVLDPIDPSALEQLSHRYQVSVQLGLSCEALGSALELANVVILRSGVVLDAAMLERAADLQVIARAGSGIDNIDIETASKKGITVFRVPCQSSQSVAEFCFALILCVSRHVARAHSEVSRGEWNKAELSGMELSGKSLGVVGAGSIGSRVLQIGRGFGMRTLGCVRTPSKERDVQFSRAGIELVDLDELIDRSDVICLTVPLTPETRGLIGPDQLSRMRNHALLINVSRAGVMRDRDLINALESGHLGGAAVDVPAKESGTTPLSCFSNVVVTPHIGAMTVDAQSRIGIELVHRLETALAGGTIADRVC